VRIPPSLHFAGLSRRVFQKRVAHQAAGFNDASLALSWKESRDSSSPHATSL
jgi:hypothetical protein